jgi:hypothetical protein
MLRRVFVAITLLMVATAAFSPSCDSLFGPDPPAKVGTIFWSGDLPGIVATLYPTSSTVANETYTAELFERGYLCATTTVMWTSAELNSGQVALASFPLTSPEHQEYQYRSSEALAEIFSVTIRT